jgi:hypothetical protein
VPARASAESIDAALEFVRCLNDIRARPGAETLPDASEACFSAADVLAQVAGRLERLREVEGEHRDLRVFLREDVAAVMRRADAEARAACSRARIGFDAPLEPGRRCLSPSDFGFHNAISQPSNRIVFLDLEYFGWDDPVKMTCDFMLHPGMSLTDEHAMRFLRGASALFAAEPTFDTRMRFSLPLYALRWTMILLNEFLPERWARRVLAGSAGERSEILTLQLQKARRMLARAEKVEGALIA